MARVKDKVVSYTVTMQKEDGVSESQTVSAKDAPKTLPKKGDSFEYEHTEVRVGQITRVVATHDDGTEEVLTELGDTHHALVVDVTVDEPVSVVDLDADATVEAPVSE